MSGTHRHAGVVWNLREQGTGPQRNAYSYDTIHSALLMDIRHELIRLNDLLRCQNCLDIPKLLRAIRRNTHKPKRKHR